MRTTPAPLVLLHGFTGSPASWDPLIARLPADRRVIRPALSGHGPSRASSWAEEVERLLALLDAEAVTDAHLVGYSMGGRLGWGLLAARPGRFRYATLVGAHPGLREPERRHARRAEDERRADELERDGIDAFVDRWARLPIWASQRALDPAILAEQDRIRRSHAPAGLAHALRVLGLGQMPPADLAAIDTPIRLVVGALDAKHRALAESLAGTAPNVTAHVVDACGHNVVLERPDALARWLA